MGFLRNDYPNQLVFREGKLCALPRKKGAGIGELTAFATVCVGMGYSDFLGMDTDDFAAVAWAYNRMEESRERGACRAAEDGGEVLGFGGLSLWSED